MTARGKIEWITNSWYGFAVIAAVLSLFSSGFGFFSLFVTGGVLMFSLFLTWLIGKLLLGRSKLTRFVVMVVSGIGLFFAGLGLFATATGFLMTWKLALLLHGVFLVSLIAMYGRTLRVLWDKSVKTYFASE